MRLAVFEPCEICGTNEWKTTYEGPIRHGSFGNFSPQPAIVGQCAGCGVQRLREADCADAEIYETAAYRELLHQPTDADGFFAEHDILQLSNLAALWPEPVRGRTVADVGCAAGSFLDHVSGLAARAVAIEPCTDYHASLARRGYDVHSYASDAVIKLRGEVDLATSFSVIEHVGDPLSFLSEIRELLTSDGRLIVSTPNREDILQTLLPDDYPAFFYRAVHRWYFDAESLAALALQASLKVRKIHCTQRFGLSNTMRWLRDRKPGGREPLTNINALADSFWTGYLAAQGVGDYLYAEFGR